jgi:putative membrane protein (TIGR04086 family)
MTVTRTDVRRPAATDLEEFRAIRPTVVRWGAVLSGGAIGLAIFGVLTALWMALGFGSDVSAIRDNLQWYIGASAVVSLFIGALLAGWYAGVRGWGAGLANGLTMWGLLFVVTALLGVPSILTALNLGRQVTTQAGGLLQPGVSDVMWATFWSLVIAGIASGIGGAIGGAMVRPDAFYAPSDVDRDDDVDVRRTTRAS